MKSGFIGEEAMFGSGLIENHTVRESVTPAELDGLLAEGWRHFGNLFFRYNAAVMGGKVHLIIPLRIQLDRWVPTRSQRRVSKKNSDLRVEIRPAEITPEKEAIFFRHAERFEENRPTRLTEFLHPEPAKFPCRCDEVAVYLGTKLIAVSFLAVGDRAVSSVYGIFDPDYGKRSLGILTMLEEIRYARGMGMLHYYLGYATVAPSHYDYKKGFSALSAFDWEGNWLPIVPKTGRGSPGNSGLEEA